MLIQKIAVGELATNTYFYIDKDSKHGFLIDPGDEANKLLVLIKNNHWTIEKILLTHGHFDHIGAAQTLHDELNIPYFIHNKGELLLSNPDFNLSGYYGCQPIILRSANYLEDNDKVALETNPSMMLTLIHTPGHTVDSAIYYDQTHQIAFTGDTIFKGSVGSTSFPSSNQQQLYTSIAKIHNLPAETKLYPGHFAATSVAEEIQCW